MDYRDIKPMGAKAPQTGKAGELLTDPSYVAEPKYDGSRFIAQVVKDRGVVISSRRESVSGGMVDRTSNVPHIVAVLKSMPQGTVIDGEITVSGKRDFHRVQGIMGSLPARAVEMQKDAPLVYAVFDLLYLAGEDVRGKPLHERRALLEKLLASLPINNVVLLTPQYTAVNKGEFLSAELKSGAEGIMLKNLNTPYIEGKKPEHHWYKIKKCQTYDGVVVGFKPGKGKYANTLGALVVAQYVDGTLKEVADVGGMTDAQREEFKAIIESGKELVVEFKAQEAYGNNNRYRHPRFLRVREDKSPSQCLYEGVDYGK